MNNGNAILAKIETNMIKIKGFGVKKIGLFGSFARGEQNDTSDIDILVEFYQNHKTFDNYMDLKFYLEDLLNRKVDLVIAEAIKPDLKPNITGSVRYAQGI
ncbi:nucleotidyltransferase family protein [Desulfoscipio gibsoniae]|uniref:Putative nucleotidyltransferase n=1 Tax=Desulfoscipio gibsoniae DSM 7213 TaxID=767817 RepID=R4KML5_9FIRM|nr:nucleotidyltransferase family protein [Desulfoscipio gibsoniae]AGL03924.1 putative nucleotidyltransferase [Desulfoscipio gibsoniae DSM 7213]